MTIEKFEDDEIYPPSASESGGNAYYVLGCQEVGHNAPYASCLKKIKDRTNGRLSVNYADCSAAIGKGTCQAAKMRREELVENKAIYFVSRQKLRDFNQARDEQALQSIRYPEPRKSSKVNSQASEMARAESVPAQEVGYAAAINKAIENSLKTQETQPQVKAEGTALKAGMSLLEIARAKRAEMST